MAPCPHRETSKSHYYYVFSSGAADIPTVHTVVPADVAAGGEDHEEDNHDAEEDEGDGAEGDLLQVAAGQRARHR